MTYRYVRSSSDEEWGDSIDGFQKLGGDFPDHNAESTYQFTSTDKKILYFEKFLGIDIDFLHLVCDETAEWKTKLGRHYEKKN